MGKEYEKEKRRKARGKLEEDKKGKKIEPKREKKKKRIGINWDLVGIEPSS